MKKTQMSITDVWKNVIIFHSHQLNYVLEVTFLILTINLTFYGIFYG